MELWAATAQRICAKLENTSSEFTWRRLHALDMSRVRDRGAKPRCKQPVFFNGNFKCEFRSMLSHENQIQKDRSEGHSHLPIISLIGHF